VRRAVSPLSVRGAEVNHARTHILISCSFLCVLITGLDAEGLYRFVSTALLLKISVGWVFSPLRADHSPFPHGSHDTRISPRLATVQNVRAHLQPWPSVASN
jgi:hypothetical protein